VKRDLMIVMVMAWAGLGSALPARGSESIWIEAEHLKGVRGSCFPDMGGKTNGNWALSGPGIAPEWTQGGESEWLSIACGPDDDKAVATFDFEVPEAASWRLWVRYRDWREQTEIFAVRVEQPNQTAASLVFGEHPVIDENDELKLLWQWAFGWDVKEVKLQKGPATLTLLAHVKQKVHRQVDCFCLTTDKDYHPYHKEKPNHVTWQLLDELRRQPGVSPKPLAARVGQFTVPPAWKPGTFQDKGFLYLWNVGKSWLDDVASTDPKRMLFPFAVEAPVLAKFREAYGGRNDVPIFRDSRIVPTFHSAGPNILDDPHFVKWLDANPGRPWANMMNYVSPMALSAKAKANWPRYRDRYVGNIAGESLEYAQPDAKTLQEKVKAAKNREEVLAALTDGFAAASAQKQKVLFGDPVPQPYQLTISCMSAGMTAFAHACREWGARTVGFENTAITPSLAMRLAFLRGGARQYGGLWATYRSSNFGDAATMYSEQGLYAHPKYVYDNYYDPWAGAGMTWYKFDIWHQYLSGSALFYHEQGFDEFWVPGGGSAGPKPIQLSPKGRLVEQFLQLSSKHPDRGVPFTPIAFLLDRAHGWDPNAYQPTYFGQNAGLNPDVVAFNRHARMLKEWFKVAYHPYGPKEAALNTGVNAPFIPGVFGDIFDVLVTSPTKMDGLDQYPVIILNGEVTLTAASGKRLAAYINKGGTLVVSDDQVTGPGAAELELPTLGELSEDTVVQWVPNAKRLPSQRYRYRPIQGGEPLATASKGSSICSIFEKGKGRLVFLSIPRGLGIDGAATPLIALVLANARQGLFPLEVEGEVEWLLNKTDKGWLLALLNPAGVNKPQHGVVPTDYAQKRSVTIHSIQPVIKVSEWFDDKNVTVSPDGIGAKVRLVVPAGGIRILDIE
jgi:hypothetical protein